MELPGSQRNLERHRYRAHFFGIRSLYPRNLDGTTRPHVFRGSFGAQQPSSFFCTDRRKSRRVPGPLACREASPCLLHAWPTGGAQTLQSQNQIGCFSSLALSSCHFGTSRQTRCGQSSFSQSSMFWGLGLRSERRIASPFRVVAVLLCLQSAMSSPFWRLKVTRLQPYCFRRHCGGVRVVNGNGQISKAEPAT